MGGGITTCSTDSLNSAFDDDSTVLSPKSSSKARHICASPCSVPVVWPPLPSPPLAEGGTTPSAAGGSTPPSAK